MEFNYYFLVYNKKRTTNHQKKFNEESEEFDTSCQLVKAKNFDSVMKYLRKKYGQNIQILEEKGKSKEDHIYIEKFRMDPNFEKSDTFKSILKSKPKYFGHAPIVPRVEQNRAVIQKETIDANAQKVIELIQKGLKLKPSDKIVLIYRIPEGYGVGDLDAESGMAVTSTDKYVYYWLAFKPEKGYYLDPFNVSDIETIK